MVSLGHRRRSEVNERARQMTEWRIVSWNGVTQGPYRTHKAATEAAERVNRREVANGYVASWRAERAPEHSQAAVHLTTPRGTIDVGS